MQFRLAEKSAFIVCGRSTWISGQDNSLFGKFWAACHQDGTVAALKESARPMETEAEVIGVSRVEKDPRNRAFTFMIAAENACISDGEQYTVPACTWAIFRNQGKLPDALVEAKMEAFMKWLPSSGYEHAPAPELEAYRKDGTVEFWLPVDGNKKA